MSASRPDSELRGRPGRASEAGPATAAGYLDHPPRMGFFTDTSVCIGCKACEVACKEWNDVPEDGLTLTGMSYDNTGRAGRLHLAARRVHRADRAAAARATRTAGAGDSRWLMSSDVCKHCTARRLPRRLPDRRAVPHRVRHRGRPGGHLQRLRLLRSGLPVRRHRAARGRRPARASARSATTGSARA